MFTHEVYEKASVTNSHHYSIINLNSGIRVFVFDARFGEYQTHKKNVEEMDHPKIKKKLYVKL